MPSEQPIFHDRVFKPSLRLRGLAFVNAVAAASLFIIALSVSYFILNPLCRSLL